jgi:hypothetical protein
MKKWLLFALLLVPYLAVDSVRIGNAVDNANDPLAVHRWDNPWDSDLNVSGYILGNTYLELPENLNDDCGLKFILGTDKVSGEARLAAYYTSGYCVNGLSYTNKTLGVGLGAVADGALNIGGFYIAKGAAPWPAYGLSAVSEGAGIPIMVDSCSYTGAGCDDEFDSIASVGSIVLRNCEIDAFGNLCDSNDAMLCFGGSSCYTSTAKMYWDNSENSIVLVPGNLIPYANGTGNLGSSSYFFNQAYIDYVNAESITAPDGELSINSNVVVDNGLASSTLRVKSDRDSELVLEDNIVNQTIRTKGGYLVLSPDAGWMEVNPVLNDSILLGSAPLQWNSLYANNLYSSRIYPDYTDVAKSWGIGKLDLGIFGTYPTLEPYSDGPLGNVGAIHNGAVIYTNPLTGDVGDPSLVLIKIGVGSAIMAFDSSDAPGTFRFDSNIKSPSGFGHYFVDGTGNYKSLINQDGSVLRFSGNDSVMTADFDMNVTADNFIGNLDGKANNATYADFSGDSDTVDSKHADDFLWLDGSKTMLGDLDMGVYPVASSLGSLSFKVKDGNYFLFLNETGDITTMLSDKGQLYLYDFLGGSNYLGIMYLANNAYISSSSGGITFEPNSYLVNVIGNITANRFIGKSDNSTYSGDSHKLDGYHYNTLPTLRNNTYSYVEQNNTSPDGYSWDFFGSNSAGNHVVGMGMLTAPSGGSSYLTVQNMFNTTDGLRFILQPINDINKTATTGAKLVMYGNYYGTDYLSLWNDANHTGNLNVSGGNLTLQPNGYNVGIRTLYPNYTLDVLGDMRATNLYSSDGTKGITNTTGFWMCTDSSCTNKCQAQIKNGLITGCT